MPALCRCCGEQAVALLHSDWHQHPTMPFNLKRRTHALCAMHRLQDLLCHGAVRRSLHGPSALIAGRSGFRKARLELPASLALVSRSWQRVLDSGLLHAPLAAIDISQDSRRFKDIQGLAPSVRLAQPVFLGASSGLV